MHDADVTPFLPLVRRIANRMGRRVSVEHRDELFADGLLGLVQALQRKPEGLAGEQLEAYVTRRVKGAMLDGARASSPAFRQLRAARRAHARAVAALGGAPTPEALAAKLDMSPDRYAQHLQFLAGHHLSTHSEYDDTVAVHDKEDPAQTWGQVRDLARAMTSLPEAQRSSVELHYFQGVSNRDIARRLGLHESRISQLQRKAIHTLRASLDGAAMATAA
jgi:RNA polymerase sigma factor for flagellar operon FliA